MTSDDVEKMNHETRQTQFKARASVERRRSRLVAAKKEAIEK
jgi:hypothetical protein